MTTQEKRDEKIHAITELKLVCDKSKDKVVYCIITHVSKSGMQRRIRLYMVEDNQLVQITYYASKILGWSMDDRGLKVNGCGMDMAFHTVYCLTSTLYPGEKREYALTSRII